MPQKIRWGIIGLGKIAHKFAQDLRLTDSALLHAVASRDMAKAKSFAQNFGSPKYYGTYEELAMDPEIDIVYIATPHALHFENTMLCLKNSKAVLCEKPLGMNSREVKTMINEAKTRNLFLMEALWTRFIPGTEKLLELQRSNAVGEIEYIKADFGFLGDGNPNGRVYNRDLGGGSLMDIGIYPIFLSLLLMGVPADIKAVAKFTPTKVDSFCAMLFDYSSGEKAILESTILADTPIEAMIYGSNGAIKLHRSFHHTERITVTKNDGTTETINTDYKGNGYYHEIVDVMESLQNSKIENHKMPHSMSIDLSETMDRVREIIGLTYPSV